MQRENARKERAGWGRCEGGGPRESSADAGEAREGEQRGDPRGGAARLVLPGRGLLAWGGQQERDATLHGHGGQKFHQNL